MKARWIPNIISITRIILVLPVAVSMLQQQYALALGLFLIAGASDGLDGFLARRFNWASPLGALLDPIGDKLLMVTSYLVLGWLGDLPWWLVVAVILRDLVIVTGAVFYRFLIGEVVYKPLMISKINTVVQILLVVITLAMLAGFEIMTTIQLMLEYIVMFTTVTSGIGYVYVWTQQARRQSRAKQV